MGSGKTKLLVELIINIVHVIKMMSRGEYIIQLRSALLFVHTGLKTRRCCCSARAAVGHVFYVHRGGNALSVTAPLVFTLCSEYIHLYPGQFRRELRGYVPLGRRPGSLQQEFDELSCLLGESVFTHVLSSADTSTFSVVAKNSRPRRRRTVQSL